MRRFDGHVAARMRDFLCLREVLPGDSASAWIRTGTGRDVEALAGYFQGLSRAARHNRFMGAVGNLTMIARDCLLPTRKVDCFTFLAECRVDGHDVIIGEASYESDGINGFGEFAISVADRFRSHGLGLTLLASVQSRAASLGHFDLFGEALKTNDEMKNLARKAGFEFTRSPDWRAVRFEKRLHEA
jgi:GNAT superfamily N-acetyltransferase